MNASALTRIFSHLTATTCTVRSCSSRNARLHILRTFSSSPVSLARRRIRKPTKKDENTPAQSEALRDVNFFEEDDGPNPKRRRVSTTPWGTFEDEDSAEVEEDIEDLEDEVASFKFDDKMPYELARKIFTDEQIQHAPSFTEEELASINPESPVIDSSRPLPRQSQVLLDRLNETLEDAAQDSQADENRKQLWRWYERCKPNVPGLLDMIPKKAWDLMWSTQNAESLANEDRLAHLAILAEDMRSVGWRLTEEQRHARVEGLFVNGKEAEALKEWELSAASVDCDNPKFLELGIRMYALQGNTSRAIKLLDRLSVCDSAWNPGILLPIISGCAGKSGDEDLRQAWDLYQRFRERLGVNMKIQDYDQISLAFLSADRKDHALAVFRDMMLSGNASNTKPDSKIVMEQMSRLMSQGRTAEDVTSDSLQILTYLPRKFQNKYFYASWLKRLIGGGEVNAAAQVIELMYERGIPPDAKHMNGLIGAWLRYGDDISTSNAEKISWSMIQRRIDFVQHRRLRNEGKAPKKKTIFQNDDGKFVPPFVQRPVPAATMETFSILVAHYLGQEKYDQVRHLRNLLPEAEIPMNAFFMNHLLLAEIVNQGWRKAWSRFEVMSRTVIPNADTFISLWENMKLHIDSGEIEKDQSDLSLPSPRDLFRRMMEWFKRLQGQQRAQAWEDMDNEIYHDVVRCFFLSKDVVGAFIALDTMKNLFGIYPEPRSVRMVAMQIARLNDDKRKRDFKAQAVKAQHQESQMKAYEILNLITDDRRDRLSRKGYKFEELDAKQQAEENHRAFVALLYSIASQRHSRGNVDFQAVIDQACSEMSVGVLDINAATALVIEKGDV